MTVTTPVTVQVENGLTVDFRYQPSDSWTAICHSDDDHKTLVRGDGALLYGYRSTTWNTYRFDRTVEFSLAGDEPCTAVRQATEHPASALVETTLHYPTATLRLLSFRHWRDRRAYDVVCWDVEEIGAGTPAARAVQVEIFDRQAWFTSGPRGASPRIYAVSGPAEAAVEWWYDRNDASASTWSGPDDGVVIRSHPQQLAVAQSGGFRPVAAFCTVPAELAPGERIAGVLVLPLDGRDVEELDDSWLTSALEAERAYWRSLLPDGLPIEVPDAGVQALLQASARNLLQARVRRGDRRVFAVGHTIYSDFWVADGYFILEAARYLGLDEAADESLGVLETHVRDDGSIVALQDVGHTKETAIAIAMLVRQAELAGDLRRLDDWWETIGRAIEHIASLHTSTLDLPESSPARGLMPPAFPDGGVAGRRFEYTTTLWCLAGLRLVAETAEHVSRSDAGRYREVYSDLRLAFERHALAHVEPLADGHHYLPMVLEPGAHHFRPGVPASAPEDAIRPETATWALAHAIYPGEVFRADDPLVEDYLHLLDLRDDDEHIPATTGWLPYRAVWSYYASFAAHAFLWAGRPDKAVEYLYGFANHAAPTGVWREEQALQGAGHNMINGDMPHNWASAEFIRLVRNLLVFERGNDLLILPGVPAGWLHQKGGIRVDTPTRFGRARLQVNSDSEAGHIGLDLDAGAMIANRVTIYIPAGQWSVTVNGVETSMGGPCKLEVGHRT